MAIGCFAIYFSNKKAHYTDRDLISLYRDHIVGFEKLRKMLYYDKNIGYNNGVLVGGVDDVRKNEYIGLITEIDPNMNMCMDYNGTIRFIFLIDGLMAIGPGKCKGIEYTPTDNKERYDIVGSLDSMQDAKPGVYMRRLAPNWYIFIQIDDWYSQRESGGMWGSRQLLTDR